MRMYTLVLLHLTDLSTRLRTGPGLGFADGVVLGRAIEAVDRIRPQTTMEFRRTWEDFLGYLWFGTHIDREVALQKIDACMNLCYQAERAAMPADRGTLRHLATSRPTQLARTPARSAYRTDAVYSPNHTDAVYSPNHTDLDITGPAVVPRRIARVAARDAAAGDIASNVAAGDAAHTTAAGHDAHGDAAGDVARSGVGVTDNDGRSGLQSPRPLRNQRTVTVTQGRQTEPHRIRPALQPTPTASQPTSTASPLLTSTTLQTPTALQPTSTTLQSTSTALQPPTAMRQMQQRALPTPRQPIRRVYVSDPPARLTHLFNNHSNNVHPSGQATPPRLVRRISTSSSDTSDDESLGAITHSVYAAATEEPESCPICMETLAVNDSVARTPCGHLFHAACLYRSIEVRPTCPLCRGRLPNVRLL